MCVYIHNICLRPSMYIYIYKYVCVYTFEQCIYLSIYWERVAERTSNDLPFKIPFTNLDPVLILTAPKDSYLLASPSIQGLFGVTVRLLVCYLGEGV